MRPKLAPIYEENFGAGAGSHDALQSIPRQHASFRDRRLLVYRQLGSAVGSQSSFGSLSSKPTNGFTGFNRPKFPQDPSHMQGSQTTRLFWSAPYNIAMNLEAIWERTAKFHAAEGRFC
jgi:hypothetical protein